MDFFSETVFPGLFSHVRIAGRECGVVEGVLAL